MEAVVDKIDSNSKIDVNDLLAKRIEEVTSEIEKTEGLTIDGILEHETKPSEIKVINENLKEAFSLSIDSIVFNPIKDIIKALQTGLFDRVYGVTRIVGYYSRVSNWNKSKLSELKDRRAGNYWEALRVNSEKIRAIGEK